MNDAKSTITLLACCCIVLTIAASASADFVGVTTVNKDDPDTEFWCTQGNGVFVPGPLTVCNVYAAFDDPNNRLLSVGNADLQVYNGANPDVFFQHPFNFTPFSPSCGLILAVPDLICDTFITIGYKCGPDPPAPPDATASSGDFEHSEFTFNGHLIGCWFNANPFNDQGTADTWPNLQVLFLQSSVAQGLSLSGHIDIFWNESYPEGDTFAEFDVPIECVAVDQDPCECENGRVTLCHIPPGNLANGRTITVGCAAGDKHLAHGDFCGPCE